MRIQRQLVASILVCTLLLSLITKAESDPSDRRPTFAELENTISTLMTAGDVPGLSIVVIQNARVAWHKDFGRANASTNQPVKPATVFEAASLSKPVFAYCVLRLVDKGKLDLDTPLARYMPKPYVEDDPNVAKITARFVLSHRTGFPNWRGREALRTNFTPGERFSYSGEGFVYLQRVIEQLTGEPLDAVVKREVFVPLGMTSSSYVWQESFGELKATGHDTAGGSRPRREKIEANAAASLHTTTSDYAKFVIAILNRTGLKKSTFAAMLRPQIQVDEACSNCVSNKPSGKLSTTISWGLGWGLQQSNGIQSFWHWGDNGDIHTFVMGSQKDRSGVVIFTDSGNGHSIIPSILEKTYDRQQPLSSWIHYEAYNSPAKTLLRSILVDGVAALSRYETDREKNPSIGLNEQSTNGLGYALLNRGKLPESIEVFKLNVKDHPTSGNTYDSLGEAYLKAGEKTRALESYKKAIEVEPKYPGAADAQKIISDLEKAPKD
ncbi:MAG TPA: serine hydrolase [Pyrinomonadaceae bacterium]|nr:serine hydrolase [Pyrinomonadaceae bacterium]